MVDLSVDIGKLKLDNPVLTASGTFGYGTEYMPYFDVNQLGAIITKTITLEPRLGNPMPRISETPGGMLNSIGLANVGVKKFIQSKLPALENLSTKVIVNVAGNTVEEYAEVVRQVNPFHRVDGFEVNISCPNVKEGGLAFGTVCQSTFDVVQAVRGVTEKPVIVKLTPNVTDIVSIAQSAVEAGADALSLINTLLGMNVNIHTRKPGLGRNIGGLSGPVVKPVAVAKVFQVAQAVDVPIIGLGGVMTWEDAIEFFLVGAKAIQVGTCNFIHPSGALTIKNGIEEYCNKKNIKSINDLVGKVELNN